MLRTNGALGVDVAVIMTCRFYTHFHAETIMDIENARHAVRHRTTAHLDDKELSSEIIAARTDGSSTTMVHAVSDSAIIHGGMSCPDPNAYSHPT